MVEEFVENPTIALEDDKDETVVVAEDKSATSGIEPYRACTINW